MRMRKKKWALKELGLCSYYYNNPVDKKNRWLNEFENNNPIHIDLGCGKGIFLSKLAKDNPNINYIGIDISTDILGVARRNIEQAFGEDKVKNIKLIRYNIEYCDNLFGENDKVERLYIYFCNPWPKNSHKKRRLTHNRQLKTFKTFLKQGGLIYFKTDDDGLFKDTLKYFESEGFAVLKSDRNINESDNLTEHEIMFREEGKPIKFIKAVCNK